MCNPVVLAITAAVVVAASAMPGAQQSGIATPALQSAQRDAGCESRPASASPGASSVCMVDPARLEPE